MQVFKQNNNFLRENSIKIDSIGIDPLLDKSIGKIMEINEYDLHEIRQEERGRPDLISYKFYNTVDLWWVIMAYNRKGNHLEIVEGTVLKIPMLTSITEILTDIATEEETGALVSF